MDRPLIVKSDKLKEGLSFDLSHEDVVEQLLPVFEKEVLDECLDTEISNALDAAIWVEGED